MKREPLYSSSSRVLRERGEDSRRETPQTPVFSRVRELYKRHSAPFLIAAGTLAALAVVLAYSILAPHPPRITQGDIAVAIKETLSKLPEPPSHSAVAYASVEQAVVRVEDLSAAPKDPTEIAVGTGVVIQKNGTILTALHVVAGAPRITVVFYNGLRSTADLIQSAPQDDLALLKARDVPANLEPATMGSAAGLMPGDHVIAVGYPFDIGPSVTSGIVSGLNREYLSPEGQQKLSNLIQFDAAVNPGNSGGPLVTNDGSVVGIVTAILNPTGERVFIGIGFAVPIEQALGGIGEFPF